jgi:hypothetical protein
LIWYSLGVEGGYDVFFLDPGLPALGDTSVVLTANKTRYET